MKKGIAIVLLCFVAVTALLLGCSKAQAEMAHSEDFIGGDKVFTNQSSDYLEPATYEDFKGKRFSIVTGSLFDGVADRIFNASEKLYFNNTVEEIEAVKLGKADAALMDDVTATLSLQAGQYDDLQALPVPLAELDFEYGVFSMRQDIIEQYNEFLAHIKADGTLKEMQDRWLKSYAFEAVMPEIPLTGENGTLTAAIMATYPPFTFAGENGKFSGFDIEQLRRFAAWLGKDIRFVDMDFGAMMSYVASGKADIGGSVYITNERKESFLFSDPDYMSKTVLVVRKHQQETPVPGRSYTWFSGKTVGNIIGAVSESVVPRFGAIPAYYQDLPTGVEDVRNGRIAGLASDLSALRVLVSEPGNEDMEAVEIPASFFVSPMGAFASFDNQALIDEFNAFLAIAKSDGTLEKMKNRWFKGVTDLKGPMPELVYSGEKGVLNVAMVGTNIPFDFFGENGELKGYAIELTNRFAAHAGYTVKYYPMQFDALIPAVTGGKVDIAVTSVSITEERKKSVLFSNSIYDDQLGIITLKIPAGVDAASVDAARDKTGAGFIEWLKSGIQRNLITENRWKMILDGMGVTITISLLAQVFGTLLGGVLCFVLMHKSRFISGLGRLYCSLIRGLPMVVLLMISYYIIFGKTDVNGVLIAVCAFALVEGASVASNLKGAIDTVDIVEIEAARSLGFTAFGAFQKVTLPQAIRRALPAYCAGFIELVKATAIVGYIAIQDLTRAGDIIRSRTYDAFFPLLFVAAIYLIVTSICVYLFQKLFRMINKEVR
ncbi:MAG: ABC transporter permease subunit [Desulfotomaculaceae bacterium]|nr:ABC transporter permease subunit [Desulfotomaculaceae bacterium]